MGALLLVVGLILLFIITATTIIPLIILGIGVALVYYSLKKLVRSTSFFSILWWVIVGFIGLSIIAETSPVIVVILATATVYYFYKQFKKKEVAEGSATTFDYDDFTSFESEWKSMMSKHQ